MNNLKETFEKLGKNWSQLPFVFWRKFHTLLFLIFLLGALGFGAFVWYENIYNQQWSEEKKAQFVQERDKSVVFKEAAFKKVIEENISRKRRFEELPREVRNIFAPY